MQLQTLSAFRRHPSRTAEPLKAPLRTDLLGSELRYYAVIDGRAWTSGSVRALAAKLGKVTLHGPALAESLSLGLPLRDATVLAEVRSIPPHTTLNPDGTLTAHEGPRATRELNDSAALARELRALLEEIVAEEEPRHAIHLVGFTGGKDSRILAALPKADRSRWHHLSIAGRDDAEHLGARASAERLQLEHFSWLEWTKDFLDGGGADPQRHRRSADLANGIGAVSDFTLLRSNFEAYRSSLGKSVSDPSVAIWQGTLADGLFAATWLQPPASNLKEALQPRTAHLKNALAPEVHGRFLDETAFYNSNPYTYMGASELDAGWFLRLYTRGRAYVCKALASLDDVAATQLNPYLHAKIFDLALRVSPELLAADAIRTGVLQSLGPDLDGPSAFGYRAPRYADAVFRALAAEANACAILPSVVNPALVDSMRAGSFPGLDEASATAPTAPQRAYRTHGEEPAAVVRNLRDYEHLLIYTSFLNLLAEDGVTLLPPA